MRAASLGPNLLNAYLRGAMGSRPGTGLNAYGNMKKPLGDLVLDNSTGNVIGDTGDVSTLPQDYAAGLSSGAYSTIPQGSVAATSSTPGAAPSSWLTSLTSALPSVASFLTAEQIAQVNVSRAKQGLPALPAANYAPAVGVSVSPQTSQMIMYGALAVGALFIVPKLLKRSRR